MRVTIMMVVLNVVFVGFTHGQDCPLWERDAVLGDAMGLRNYLDDSGVELEMGVTHVYQSNVRGGVSTDSKSERHSGSYDIELNIDAEKVFGFEGGRFYILSEGSWNDGINDESVGSYFGVNDDAGGHRSFDITELWYEQSLSEESDVLFRIGKLDLTGGFECRGCPAAFDSSMYANDETSQFLNSSLVNNPTIPFPDNGLGAVFYYSPQDSGVFMAFGVADADADVRTTGFDTAFDGDHDYFYILETGFTYFPDNKPGIYRFGVWHDPQGKAADDSLEENTGDTGFYVSFCQQIMKENEADDQGLGAFFRYGYAPEKTNAVTQFVSCGFSYLGLFEGRDEDVLGVGFSHGEFSDDAEAVYPEDNESVYEVYYNVQLTPAVNITPSLQYVVDPGANNTAEDAVVFAVRAQVMF